jgi:hypothetical protein
MNLWNESNSLIERIFCGLLRTWYDNMLPTVFFISFQTHATIELCHIASAPHSVIKYTLKRGQEIRRVMFVPRST